MIGRTTARGNTTAAPPIASGDLSAWGRALLELAERFDKVRPPAVRVPAEVLERALAGLDPARFGRARQALAPIVAAAIIESGRLLAARRCAGRFAGLWEFPGGKVEAGETPERAVVREFDEETGVVIYGPEIVSKGFVFETETGHLLDDAQCVILEIIEEIGPDVNDRIAKIRCG